MKAKEHGLDKNQSALLEIATEDAADGQLAKIEEIAIRNIATRARLRHRRRDAQAKPLNTQAKPHKKSKVIGRQAEPNHRVRGDSGIGGSAGYRQPGDDAGSNQR